MEGQNQEVEYQEEPFQSTPESVQAWQSHNTGLNAKMIREFTIDENIPEEIQKKWWSFWGKHVVFSNLTPKRGMILRRRARIMMRKFKQYMPYYQITPVMLDKIHQIDQLYDALLTRAEGTTRERMLQAKTTEEKRIITESSGEGHRGGFGRLRNFFGLG